MEQPVKYYQKIANRLQVKHEKEKEVLALRVFHEFIEPFCDKYKLSYVTYMGAYFLLTTSKTTEEFMRNYCVDPEIKPGLGEVLDGDNKFIRKFATDYLEIYIGGDYGDLGLYMPSYNPELEE
jgi:hypothetical protein